jgi:predicted RNA-binding Zn-ribbon protein involved in translation (DUF1610 family)
MNYKEDNIPLAQAAASSNVPVVQGEVIRGPPVFVAVPAATTTTRVTLIELPPFPVSLQCPYCNRQVVTRVVTEPGSGTYCASLLICFIFWPLFFLPCLCKDTQDTVHFCPNCGTEIGVRRFCG